MEALLLRNKFRKIQFSFLLWGGVHIKYEQKVHTIFRAETMQHMVFISVRTDELLTDDV